MAHAAGAGPAAGANHEPYIHPDADGATAPGCLGNPSFGVLARGNVAPGAHCNPGIQSDAGTNVDGNGNASAHHHTDAHVDTTPYIVAHRNPNTDVDTHANTHADTHANSHSDINTDAHSNPESYPGSVSNVDADCQFDAGIVAGGRAHSHPGALHECAFNTG